MRSFTFHVFYESAARTDIARNLLSVLNKGHQELTNKLQAPIVLSEHFNNDQDFYLKTLLTIEMQATYKRRVVSELFLMLMPQAEDLEAALKILQSFEIIRDENDKKGKQLGETLPDELNELGTDWLDFLFPGVDYNRLSAMEYKQLCNFLATALSKAAFDKEKGMNFDDFAFENLPEPLASSIKNPALYKQRFIALQQLYKDYVSVTSERAISIYRNSTELKKIKLSSYANSFTMAQILTLGTNNLALTEKIYSELFRHGILFIHNNRKAFIFETFQRYQVIKNDKLNEHSLNVAITTILKSKDQPKLPFVLPPLNVTLKPAAANNLPPTTPTQTLKKSLSFGSSLDELPKTRRSELPSFVSPKRASSAKYKSGIVPKKDEKEKDREQNPSLKLSNSRK